MSGHRLGTALAIGVVLALLFDLLLQAALVAVGGGPSRVHWEPALVGKSTWFLTALMAALVSPLFLPAARDPISWSNAFHVSGTILIAAPIIRAVATLLVLIIRLTLAGKWGSDGGVLVQPSLYSEILTSVGPWLLGGSMVRLISRHLGGETL